MGKVKDWWQGQCDDLARTFVECSLDKDRMSEGQLIEKARVLFPNHPGEDGQSELDAFVEACIEQRELYIEDNGQFGVGA